MGVAEVYASLCVRTSGEACTKCVDLCPLGPAAIRFDDERARPNLPEPQASACATSPDSEPKADNLNPPTIVHDGCVGCGVCQLYCPTTPKAIVVRPQSVTATG